MRHTNFIPMDSYSQERRDPNVLKSPPESSGGFKWQHLMRCLGLVLVLFASFNSLSAQKVLTGSGSTTCNGSFRSGAIQAGGLFYEDDVTLGKQEFVVCPSAANQNSHLTKLSITSFDVAPGDTLIIFEGCGTGGTPLTGFPDYGGGASAATSLPSNWFLAECESDGCLTVVFAPNGDNNKGTGIVWDISCEPRMAIITCPSDVVVAASCLVDPSGTSRISGNHTVQSLSGTCNVSPTIISTELFSVPVSGITTTSVGMATTIGAVVNLVPGTHSILIRYENISTGTIDTCAYDILVDSGITPVCNDNVNISLTGGCQAVITPDNILEGNHECANEFIVQLLDGENADTNIVNVSYLGTTARVQVIEPMSGNRCWGFVTVEDKLAPVLTCVDTALFCTTTTDPAVIGGQPTTTDVCSGSVTFSFTDSETAFSCRPGEVLTTDASGAPLTVAPDTIGLVVRTWTAVDGNGNISDPCTQTIYILKPQLVASDIIWPADITLYCGDGDDFTPETTGFPVVQIGGDIISLDQSCFFGLSHQDQVFETDCEGSRKILRTWTILDWCHPGTVFSNIATSDGAQFIKFVDTIGPIITNVPFFNDITITNAGHECDVDLTIPAISVSDACSDPENIIVRVVGPSNTIFSNGGTMSNIPFGTHNIIYIAEDDCGNTTSDTVSITVKDAVTPTVICKENISVSLTQDGTAWAFAQTFDDGSHDNCAIDSMRVRRMDTCGGTAFPTATEWSTSVPFECCDIGGLVLVSLGVWDESGNFNNCMVNVQVVDKVQPRIVCPPDLTIDCTANTDDLSIYGNATISGGNCNTMALGAAVVTRNVNNCGAGAIIRTWTLGTATCSQTITLELSPTETIQVDEIPAEITVNCNNVDLSIYDNGSDLTFTAVGCQTIAVNYTRTDFLGETGSCRQIVRDWEIIDWCINPNALVDADGDGYKGPGYKKVTQVVSVMDTEGPVILSGSTPVGNGPLLFSEFDVNQTLCEVELLTLPSFSARDNCSDEAIPVLVSGTIGGQVLVDATPGTLIKVPIGTYTLLYSAEDGCGNRSVVEVQIVVVDDKGPSLFCVEEISVNLGVSNVPSHLGGSIDVWAADFSCKIEDCSALGELLIVFPANADRNFGSRPPASARTSKLFTCNDIGRQEVDVWASDKEGNWSVVTVVINVQDNLNLCDPITPPVCDVSFAATGGAGMIDLTMITGDLPYTISWRGPVDGDAQLTSGNTFNIPSLLAGTYTVFVTNLNCSISRTVVVTPEQPVCDVSFVATGEAGAIAITMATGDLPYSISWRGPMDGDAQLTSGNMFTTPSLPAGTYTVFVTNLNCSISQAVVVAPVCDVTFAAIGGAGMINLTMVTGDTPYSISWRGPEDGDAQLTDGNTFTIPSLAAGTYTVFVTNRNCSTSMPVIVREAEPTTCDVTFAAVGGAGVIDITVATGDSPYSISWRGPMDGDAQLTSGNTFNISSLPAGRYTVFVTNLNCSTSMEVIVTEAELECDVMFAVTSGSGFVNITMATGDLPYTISWRGPVNGDAQLTSGNTFTIPSLSIGEYTIFVTNRTCSVSQTVNVTLPGEEAACDVMFTATSETDLINITMVTGSLPYEISWIGPVNGDAQLTSGNTFTIPSLPVGVYTVSVTNANCTTTQTVTVCPTITFTAISELSTGEIEVTMVNVALPATISWSGPSMNFFRLNSGNSHTISSLVPGRYTVFVSDRNGCNSSQVVDVIAADDGAGDGDGSQAAISGTILNETGASVENVLVQLAGSNKTPVITGATGNYQFAVPMHNNYTVTPQKEMNPLNGVSTFDLVLISKHILGIELLDTPYKHIAADINKSGTITAFDMVQLRQLILNISADFPNNDAWRFVDANYQFATNNPENESFAEIAAINDLSADMNAHFVAVKIGDVSGNAAANTLASSEARSFNGAVTFSTEDQIFERGELVEVAFNLKDMDQVIGYQFTLDIDPTVAKIVELKEGVATEANFGLMNVERGQLTTSWNQNDADAAGDMFTLILKANQAGRLSEVIQLTSELTAKEAYSNAGQLMDVTLDFGATDKTFKLYQNTPNPFKDVTTISFDLPAATTGQLTIFDVSGKLIKSISGEFNKGYNEVQINKSELAENGIYFYNLETAGHVAKKRMILID